MNATKFDENVIFLHFLVKKLESDNVRLSNSTRWKDFASGGTIVLIGMLIGSLLPRGGRQRTRRLKL